MFHGWNMGGGRTFQQDAKTWWEQGLTPLTSNLTSGLTPLAFPWTSALISLISTWTSAFSKNPLHPDIYPNSHKRQPLFHSLVP